MGWGTGVFSMCGACIRLCGQRRLLGRFFEGRSRGLRAAPSHASARAPAPPPFPCPGPPPFPPPSPPVPTPVPHFTRACS